MREVDADAPLWAALSLGFAVAAGALLAACLRNGGMGALPDLHGAARLRVMRERVQRGGYADDTATMEQSRLGFARYLVETGRLSEWHGV